MSADREVSHEKRVSCSQQTAYFKKRPESKISVRLKIDRKQRVNMRFVCLALIVVVALVVPFSRAETCYQDPDRCSAGKCCKQFDSSEHVPFGTCKPLQGENEMCELSPIMNRRAKHVYVNLCPCAEGLECLPSGKSELTGVCGTKKK